jgi:phosphoserine phosphatase
VPDPHRKLGERILVTVTGPDHPGITATLAAILARSGIALLDMQQVVVQGRLNLAILIEAADGGAASVLKDLLFAAKEHGADLDFRVMEAEPPPPHPQYVLTLLGDPTLDAAAVAGIAAVLARHGVNIEKIQRLSDQRFATLEMTIGVPNERAVHDVRADLVHAAAQLEVDVALQAEGLFRRAKRLVVFDLDSTLVRGETIDALGRQHGVGDRIEEVTRRAMNGEIDFAAALRQRVALLAGLPERALHQAAEAAELMPGALALVAALRQLGYRTAIVSGGFSTVAEKLRQRLGIDWAFANELEIEAGSLTGRVREPILDAAAKARIVRDLAAGRGIALDQVIAVGDGANDLPMLEVAGLGIAFNAHAAVRQRAPHLLNRPRLDSILFLLGIAEKDIRALQPKEPA